METTGAGDLNWRTAWAQLLGLLTPAERRQGALVLCLVIAMALIDTAGVASVMPFLAVLGNPDLALGNPLIRGLNDRLGFANTDGLLYFLAAVSFGLIVISAGLRLLTEYAIIRYTSMRAHSVAMRLLESYLRQPYAYFLDRQSSDMAKSILSETDLAVTGVLRPALILLAYTLVTIAVVVLLFTVDPMLALAMTMGTTGVYAAVYFGIRNYMHRIGTDRVNANAERFAAATEAFTGIKDIKLLGRERAYLERFRDPSERHARHRSTQSVLSTVPKNVVEAIAYGGIVAMALYLMSAGADLGKMLPVLGLYAFAGYRLLPSLQRVYASATELRFGLPAIGELRADMDDRRQAVANWPEPSEPIVPRESIRLRNVSFSYPGARKPALRDVDLEIAVGSTTAIVGETGAGKTTAVDLLLGLLSPTEGHLEVDGQIIGDGDVRRWQMAVGYVPQEIFLTNESVAENIALGIPRQLIDMDAVVRAARLAQIHDFVVNELPRGYDTVVGERGIRLSGGQRQRIGIARALYHDPAVVVFDEATSALDDPTTTAVLDSIVALRGTKTIIMIAHRLSTVAGFDRIWVLKDGRIEGGGSYQELMDRGPELRRLAGVAP